VQKNSGPDLMEVWDREHRQNLGTPCIISATIEASNLKFGTHLVWGVACQKQLLGPKLVGI